MPVRSDAFEFDGVVPSVLIDSQYARFGWKDNVRKNTDRCGNADVEKGNSLSEGFDLRIRMTIEGRSAQQRPATCRQSPARDFCDAVSSVERDGDDELTMHHLMLGDYSVGVLSLTTSLNQTALR
jgi:hypothetical protein